MWMDFKPYVRDARRVVGAAAVGVAASFPGAAAIVVAASF
jgi:hypothetical protein